jgi:hypothetical protein
MPGRADTYGAQPAGFVHDFFNSGEPIGVTTTGERPATVFLRVVTARRTSGAVLSLDRWLGCAGCASRVGALGIPVGT